MTTLNTLFCIGKNEILQKASKQSDYSDLSVASKHMTQFFVHLILRIIENPLTRAFANDCQLHQLRRPGDVVWGRVRDGDDEVPDNITETS